MERASTNDVYVAIGTDSTDHVIKRSSNSMQVVTGVVPESFMT